MQEHHTLFFMYMLWFINLYIGSHAAGTIDGIASHHIDGDAADVHKNHNRSFKTTNLMSCNVIHLVGIFMRIHRCLYIISISTLPFNQSQLFSIIGRKSCHMLSSEILKGVMRKHSFLLLHYQLLPVNASFWMRELDNAFKTCFTFASF